MGPMKASDLGLGIRFLDVVRLVPKSYRKVCEYFVQLIPLIVISLIISYHQDVLVHLHVGGKSVFDLLLAGAVAAPWIAQACCMPLYIELGQEIYTHGRGQTVPLLYHLIRKNCFIPLLMTGVVAYIFHTIHNYNLEFTLHLVLVCVLQVFFAEFMVLPLTLKRFDIWLSSWIAYFLTLALLPTLWFLPPLMGILTIIVVAPKATAKRTYKTSRKTYLFWVLCGLIVGLILWFDKVIFYLLRNGELSPLYIFISLIPSLLALNFFYIFRLPKLEKVLTNTISSINNKSIHHYMEWKKYAYLLVKQTFFEILGLLIVLSSISCTVAILIHNMEWKLVILSHILTLIMTIITVIFNTLLLLRVFNLFFKMAFGFFVFMSLVVWKGQTHLLFYQSYLIAFSVIAFVFVLMARRKWKSPHMNYFGV